MLTIRKGTRLPDDSPKRSLIKMKGKIGVMFGISLVALMALSVSYALWFQTLYINGTVNTGTLDAQWSIHHAWDSEPEIKDYSNVTIVADEVDPYTLYITVNNAYPSIDYYAVVDLTNTGTIPWIVYSAELTTDEFPGEIGFVALDEVNGEIPFDDEEQAMLHEGLEVAPILPGTQVHPGDSAWGILHVHLTNFAEENTTYTFSFKVVVEQWNEYPTEPPQGYDNNEEWLADQ